jgi:hypothetical protein
VAWHENGYCRVVPVSIVSDRDPIFTFIIHRLMVRQRTIQVLEDMLCACMLEDGGSWNNHLPLIEFSYNNSYHSSIGMAPYEALYGRKCKTPLCWAEVGDKSIIGLEIIQETTLKIISIQEKMRTSKSC